MAEDTRRCNSPTLGRRIRAAERRIKAMQLRLEGLTFKEIAQKLGCSTQRAHLIVSEECKKLRARSNELAENILSLTNERIERLIQVHWQSALAGDKNANDMVFRLIDRQARLLGADAPRKTQTQVELTEKDPEQLRAQARMMGLDLEDIENGTAEDSAAKGKFSPGPKDRAGRDAGRGNPSDGREGADRGDSPGGRDSQCGGEPDYDI